ncbi:MAG TPA: DNA sulfur modification protein DndE [Candidatus Eisenbacteria bacterium]|nr:DNA sulfur modification protein DndE [Candidatus Eisenbacteria bacterium]
MKLAKLRLTREASNRLPILAARTGLTPNLLCRIGFCLSLGEQAIPNPDNYPEEDREFNRYTLLGEYDPLFVALLTERCRQDNVDLSMLADYFRAHMNRGVILLHSRIKSLADLAQLVPRPISSSNS